MEVRVSQPAMSVIKVKNIRNSALLARLIPAAVTTHNKKTTSWTKQELIERLKKANFTTEEINEILLKSEISQEAKDGIAVT